MIDILKDMKIQGDGGQAKVNFRFYNGDSSIPNPLLNGVKIDESIPYENLYFQQDEPTTPILNDLWLLVGNFYVDVVGKRGKTAIEVNVQSENQGGLLLVEADITNVYGNYLTLRKWNGTSWYYLDAFYWNGTEWVKFSFAESNVYWNLSNYFEKSDPQLNKLVTNTSDGIGIGGLSLPPLGNFIFGGNGLNIQKIDKTTGVFTNIPHTGAYNSRGVAANNNRIALIHGESVCLVLDHDGNQLQSLPTGSIPALRGLDIHKDGHVVTYGSSSTGQLYLYSPNGDLLGSVNTNAAGEEVRIDDNYNVYVVYSSAYVRVFDLLGGGFLRNIGSSGTYSVCLDKNYVYIGMSGKVAIYNKNDSTFVKDVLTPEYNAQIHCIEVDHLGNIYVGGYGSSSLQGVYKYDKDGNYLSKTTPSVTQSTSIIPYLAVEPGRYGVAHDYF